VFGNHSSSDSYHFEYSHTQNIKQHIRIATATGIKHTLRALVSKESKMV